MTYRSHSFIRVFSICVCIVSRLANAETTFSSSSSSSSSSSGSGVVTYGTELNGGEIGIKMMYDSSVDNKMNVIISYDTETDVATNFFKDQFKPDLFKQFSDCDVIKWNFMACGTSKYKDTELDCPKGADQCKFDKIHACVQTLYTLDQIKVGNFIVCFFNNNKDVNKCVKDNGLVQNDIDQCVKDQGANYCDRFFHIIHGPESKKLFGSSSSSSSGSASSEGTTNFKKVLCEKLSNAKLQCNYCNS